MSNRKIKISIILLSTGAIICSLLLAFKSLDRVAVFNLFRLLVFLWLSTILYLNPDKIDFLKRKSFGKSEDSYTTNRKVAISIAVTLSFFNFLISAALAFDP